MKLKLEDVCYKESSNIAQKDLEALEGEYPIYGASGFIKNIDNYKQEKDYIAIVKDGAGVGRAMLLPAKSSVIGTLQYIIPRENVNTNYLYYAISHMNLSKYANGATIPHIYFKDYKNEIFELPSFDQQHKIVATLDQVNDLISIKNQQLEQLDLLIKSRFVEMFGDPVKNEKGWETKELQFVSKVGSSKRFYQEELSISGVPFLKIADILNRIDNKETEANTYISEEQYLELLKLNLVPKENDVLVTSRGTIGKCYIVSKNDKFYFQDGMITWLSNFAKYLSPIFIFYSFMMNGIRNQINSMQAGSTVAYLSIAMIKKLNIMLPPLALQTQFADFVEQVERTKDSMKQSLEQLETLKKKLMQDYFG